MQPLVLFGVLQAIGMFVGNVVQPRMQGRSLNIDPIVLLLALAFWSVVWGLPGAFLDEFRPPLAPGLSQSNRGLKDLQNQFNSMPRNIKNLGRFETRCVRL